MLKSTKKYAQTKERRTDGTAFSKGILEVAEKSSEHSPTDYSPTSNLNSPSPGGERANQENPGPPSPAEPPVPFPLPEGQQAAYPEAGMGVQGTSSGSLIESPTTSQNSAANTSPAPAASTALSLRCRTCDAPPTTITRPTVTMCGHLFCSE